MIGTIETPARWVLDAPWRETAAVAVLSFALSFVGTAAMPIFGRDEARFAQASREMLDHRELVVPTFGGEPRYHKPILIYWCTMASYAVLGVTPRAARLPSNLAAVLVVTLLAATARRRFGPGAGLLAAALLATSPIFFVGARTCTADMVLLAATLACMLALERLLAGSAGAVDAALFWGAAAVAVLAKGPIAPAWVLCTLVALWALARRWRPWELVVAAVLALLGWWFAGPLPLVVPAVVALAALLRSPAARQGVGAFRFSWGVPLFLAIVLPWTIAAGIATGGDFLREGIGRHVVARSMTAFESHAFFPGFYPVSALVVALPWLPLVLAPLVHRIRRRGEDRAGDFLLAWLVGPLVLLELVETKLVHYWLGSYPAGVLLVVGWLMATSGRTRPAIGSAGRVLLAVGGLALSAAPAVLSAQLGHGWLDPRAAAVGAPLAAAALVAAAIAGRRPRSAASTAAAGCAVFLVGLYVHYLPGIADQLMAPRAAARAVELRRAGDAIVVLRARDDELFINLPLDAVNCRSDDCLLGLLAAGRPLVGIARSDDLERFLAEHAEAPVDRLEEIDGIDSGRVEWVTTAVFRTSASSGSSQRGNG